MEQSGFGSACICSQQSARREGMEEPRHVQGPAVERSNDTKVPLGRSLMVLTEWNSSRSGGAGCSFRRRPEPKSDSETWADGCDGRAPEPCSVRALSARKSSSSRTLEPIVKSKGANQVYSRFAALSASYERSISETAHFRWGTVLARGVATKLARGERLPFLNLSETRCRKPESVGVRGCREELP